MGWGSLLAGFYPGGGVMPGLAGRGMQRDAKTPGRGQSMEENEPVCQAEMLWGKG